MHRLLQRSSFRIAAVLAAVLSASSAHAAEIRVTVTNNQPAGGFALAPVWIGVQDGTFTTFTPGQSSSSAIATLAQFGNTAPLTSLFEAANVGVDTTVTSGGALVQYLPGQSNSATLDIADPTVDRYLSFAGMVVPSNDFFMGNATPLQIFNADGSFKGPMTISIHGSDIWDSDTEQQSTTTALTFIQGETPGTGTQITGGTVQSLFGESGATSFLQSIDGLTTAAGYTISNVPTSNDLIATITISSVPEPASIVMMGIGLAGALVGYRASRRRGTGEVG